MINMRNTYSALRLMSKLPEFGKSLIKFLHKTISAESHNTARYLHEIEGDISRETLEQFDMNKAYENLLVKSPILLSVLNGAISKNKLEAVQVKCYDL